MLWIKALHIVMIASWFAGLFYLPRIFVNLAMVPKDSDAERQRLLLMAHKLLSFMHILAPIAITLGLYLWGRYGIGLHGPGNGWMHAKLLLVLLAVIYHIYCGRVLTQFESGHNRRSHTWFRWFNELPIVLMLLITILVTVKPF